MPKYMVNETEVWIGAPDAPAPAQVEFINAPKIAVGVARGAEDATLYVRFHRVGGPWQMFLLEPTAPSKDRSYFHGKFPPLPEDSVIQYEVFIRFCGTRPKGDCRVGETFSFEVRKRPAEALPQSTGPTSYSGKVPSAPEVSFMAFSTPLLPSEKTPPSVRSTSQTPTAFRPIVPPPGGLVFTVNGRVVSNSRVGVGRLRVQIVARNAGTDMVLAEAVTDSTGHYHASFVRLVWLERGKSQPDLQARVYFGNVLLGASDVRYNAATGETLNVLLLDSAEGLRSEYETLTDAVLPNYKGALSGLREATERKDIANSAKKTGLDARAMALAALANQFGQSTAPTGVSGAPAAKAGNGIQPAFFYALFRAGFPADADTLYRVDPKTVQAVWEEAITQGIIPKGLAKEIGSAMQTFQRLSGAVARSAQSPIGLSTLKCPSQSPTRKSSDRTQRGGAPKWLELLPGRWRSSS